MMQASVWIEETIEVPTMITDMQLQDKGIKTISNINRDNKCINNREIAITEINRMSIHNENQ